VGLFGYIEQYVSNASNSLSKSCTHECAIVPPAGTPKSSSAIVQAVPAHPAIYDALAPYIAAAVPCARREPNSETGRPFAARTILLDFVAISD
jgi:hypothetical protein